MDKDLISEKEVDRDRVRKMRRQEDDTDIG